MHVALRHRRYCGALGKSTHAMTSAASLRDLYNNPSSAWSFLPAPPPLPASASSSTQHTYEWKSSRTSPRSIFDLSPSQDLSDTGLDVSLLLSSLLASAVLQYTSTAIAMPWEVGRLLLQVQWVPRDAGEFESSDDIVEDEDEDVRVCADIYRTTNQLFCILVERLISRERLVLHGPK
jgi:fusion and transport protein UGO1